MRCMNSLVLRTSVAMAPLLTFTCSSAHNLQVERNFELCLKKRGFTLKRMREDGACLFRAVGRWEEPRWEVASHSCHGFVMNQRGSVVSDYAFIACMLGTLTWSYMAVCLYGLIALLVEDRIMFLNYYRC